MPTIAEELITVTGEIAEAQRTLATNLAQPAEDKTSFDPTKNIPGEHQTVASLESLVTTIAQSVRGIAACEILPKQRGSASRQGGNVP